MTPGHTQHTRPSGSSRRRFVRTQMLCAVSAALCAVAGGAAAQSAPSVGINTTVAPYCASMQPGSPTDMDLGSLVGPTGQVVSDFTGTTSYSLAGYYCNARANITLSAAPLRPTVAVTVTDASSFTDRVDYVAALSWDDVSLQVESAAGTPAQLLTSEANTGVLTVSVSDPETENNKRPVAATYSAAVTLTIAPQS